MFIFIFHSLKIRVLHTKGTFTLCIFHKFHGSCRIVEKGKVKEKKIGISLKEDPFPFYFCLSYFLFFLGKFQLNLHVL